MSSARERAIRGLNSGDEFSVTRCFSAEDVECFAEITHDFNPVHCDERYVAAKGFNSLICHGLLVGGMLTEIGGQIGWLASTMSFRFRQPVYIGDCICCVLTITEIDDRNRAKAKAVFRNQNNDTVLEAELGGVLPNGQERKIMQSMLEEDVSNSYNDDSTIQY